MRPTTLRLRSHWLLLPAVVALGILISSWQPAPARACGSFFARGKKTTLPSLSLERVLLIHDAASGRQHFIRQVAFRAADVAFGFVVPTPTRPEVDKVVRAPFDGLLGAFPFERVAPKGGGSRTGEGFGAGHGRLGGVQVLDVKRVGSFTAFVLAAQDAEALAKWLTDNGLVSNPEAERWLAHYVRMGFYYVAMRYDPLPTGVAEKGKDGDPVLAETIRISFATPVPYYPYFEPERPSGATQGERALEMWLLTNAPSLPVAALVDEGETRWVRPLREGLRHHDVRTRLMPLLDEDLAKLLPAGTLHLQTFQDQKRSRQGFGDVIFIPEKRRELSDEQRAALRPLLGVVAPALVPSPQP